MEVDMRNIEACVEQISAQYSGGGVRVVARYEEAGTISSVTIDFPADAAREFYIGQTLLITVAPAPQDKEEQP